MVERIRPHIWLKMRHDMVCALDTRMIDSRRHAATPIRFSLDSLCGLLTLLFISGDLFLCDGEAFDARVDHKARYCTVPPTSYDYQLSSLIASRLGGRSEVP